MNIEIPNHWTPRHYQFAIWKQLQEGATRTVLRWHRRSGKDDLCLHWTAVAALSRKVGNYWHMLPEYSQARKALWNAVNSHTGKRRIDEAFPLEIRKRTVDDQMFIEFINGSTWQVLGSDRYNSLVGAPPVGIVFSEYALANPHAWDYFRPMLLENKGWAIFNSTVRGRNHFWNLGEYAKSHPDWAFSELNADTSGVFTPQQLQQELEELQALQGEDDGLAIFNQEYFNNPAAATPGSYYGKLLSAADRENRVTNVPYEPNMLVTTAWDLGIGDSTAIWFVQQVGKEIRVIDYCENSGVGLEHYVKLIASKPYAYYEHILPHDADVSELGTGKRRIDLLREMGLARTRVLPRTTIEDRIQATRTTIPKCWFDVTKTDKGLVALRQYQKEYDEKLQTFKDRPRHDWCSHAADAFGYMCQGIRPIKDLTKLPRQAQTDYNIFG